MGRLVLSSTLSDGVDTRVTTPSSLRVGGRVPVLISVLSSPQPAITNASRPEAYPDSIGSPIFADMGKDFWLSRWQIPHQDTGLFKVGVSKFVNYHDDTKYKNKCNNSLHRISLTK